MKVGIFLFIKEVYICRYSMDQLGSDNTADLLQLTASRHSSLRVYSICIYLTFFTLCEPMRKV